ncbi:Ulp1 peptidase, partial [Sarracenia purpurea var. burkii]
YLWEEWKERKKQLLEDVAAKFLNLRFVPLEDQFETEAEDVPYKDGPVSYDSDIIEIDAAITENEEEEDEEEETGRADL